MNTAIVAWILIANGVAFVLFGFDKRQARLGRSRVPEARLAGVAALGGAPAAWLACSFFRHKTRKSSFRAKLAVASLVCAALYWLALRALA